MLRKKDFIKLINLKNSFPRWGTWPVGLDGAPAGSDLLDKKKPPGAQITFILVACYTQRNTYFDNGRIFHNKNRNEPWISLAKY